MTRYRNNNGVLELSFCEGEFEPLPEAIINEVRHAGAEEMRAVVIAMLEAQFEDWADSIVPEASAIAGAYSHAIYAVRALSFELNKEKK